MRTMSPDERRAFLLAGTRTAKVAVTRRDGRPYVLPVWFVLDGDDVVFMTGAETVRGRALRREGRASLCVDEEREPYSFVRINGPVTISEDPDQLHQWAGRIAARYMGEALAEQYAGRNAVPGELLVRLLAEEIVAQAAVAD